MLPPAAFSSTPKLTHFLSPIVFSCLLCIHLHLLPPWIYCVFITSALMHVSGSPKYSVCLCKSPQSHIASTSTPADLWGQRAVIGCFWSHDHSLAKFAQPSFSLALFFGKHSSFLPLTGWKWADGWGATACDPQLNSSMCSNSTHGGFPSVPQQAKIPSVHKYTHARSHAHTNTTACSCDMATLCCCCSDTVNLIILSTSTLK